MEKILFTTHERKTAQRNIWKHFYQVFKTVFKLEISAIDVHNQGIFFQKINIFFPIFKKGRGDLLSSPC